MFDDLNKTTNDNSENKIDGDKQMPVAKSVEDIFSETDKVLNSSPADNINKESVIKNESEKKEFSTKKMFFVLIGIGFLFVLVIIYLLITNLFYNVESKIDIVDNDIDKKSEDSLIKEELAEEQFNNKIDKEEEKKIPNDIMLDSDDDGLSDKEENALGLDINNIDSDGDGLFDREEVKVYKTDPLNPDTDNDGYLDGDEVSKGYNPNGAGKLYNLN